MRAFSRGALRVRRFLPLAALLPLAGLPAPLSAQALDPAEGGIVVGRVNGEVIYTENVESVLGEMHRGQSVERRSAFDLDRMAFRLVNDALLAQEARALGYHELPEIRARVEARRDLKARNRVYREEIVAKIDASEEKIRGVYEDIYRTATLQIVSRADRTEAEKLVPRVRAATDEASFAAIATEISQDQYKGRGGRIETALTNLTKSLYDFATTAAPDDVSQPLATPWGWTVARMVRLEPADPERLDERRGRVRIELRQRQETALRAALAERLRPTLDLQIDWPVFETITVQQMHDGRLLPKFEGKDRVLATVAGRAITVEALVGKLAKAWGGVSNPAVALEYQRVALDQLVFEQLLVAEGIRRGYVDTPAVRRELAAYEMSLLAARYLKEVVGTGIEVTPDEARAYYDKHRDEFRKPPALHLLQLTVGSQEEGERIVAQAKGGADFGWLVRQYSIDGLKSRGGELGWVAANEGTPIFRKELAHAAAGDLVGPKEGPEGWAVVKVDLFEDRGHYSFEEVSGNVRERIEGGKISERIDLVIQRLRQQAEIWIDRDAVASLRIVPTAPEEDASAMPGHDGG